MLITGSSASLILAAAYVAKSHRWSEEDARGDKDGFRAPGYEEACRLLKV